MNNVVMSILSHVLSFGLGVIAVYVYIKFLVSKANVSAEKIIDEAQVKADNLVKEAILDAKTKAYELKLEAEKEIKNERKELTNYENKLLQREQNIDRRDIILQGKEESLEHKAQGLEKKRTELDRMEIVLEEKIEAKVIELEKVSQMTVNEAKQELFKIVEVQCLNETTQYIKEEEEAAKAEAASKAREIISLAISRYAQETTTERTVSVVSLPSEEMKGRIIGREGRNIRALEQVTGVDLIIDDTPEAITISCFDPIRREIAKNALNVLIRDGRIQPGRIEEVVERMRSELDENMREAGEDAVFKLGLSKVNKELVQMIGRLKYRSSYGQNALQHSIEVGYLAGIMASEIGVNANLAKRAGLLHDIGKAVSYEVEGSHVDIGVKLAKKYSEHKVVINAIASHHGDTEATDVISVLVAAADTLSAARPGARSETLENYVQRLEQLEAIANSFEGIDKTFAIQAGREIRVVVVPDKVDDLGCHHIAREIKQKIESELAYPGVIKVTVVREVRVSETAR